MKAGFLTVSLLATIWTSPALAADCGALKEINTVDLLPGPGGGPRLMVPVTINNSPRKFLLSTAGAFTTITSAAAKDLNLSPHQSNVKLLNSTGNASQSYVHVDTFVIGRLGGKDMDLLVTPAPNAGANGAFDGNLAPDMLMRYDVDIDFAARKMNLFSQDHCPGKVVYWTTGPVATVPFKMFHPDNTPIGQRERVSLLPDTHIRVPVTLDGKNFLAVINTASVTSTLSASVAKRVFGLDADSPGVVQLGSVDGDPNHKVFGHVFASLAFDGIAVSNPRVTVIPDLVGAKDPNNSVSTGSLIHHDDDGLAPELTVGMDVLQHLHLYIAFDERTLYISAANAPGGAPAGTATPAAGQ
jgi:hypothetical protein